MRRTTSRAPKLGRHLSWAMVYPYTRGAEASSFSHLLGHREEATGPTN